MGMLVSFTVVEAHPVAKGLNGGRFRRREGEPLTVGLRRRVEQDTRTRVTALTEEPEGSSRYRLTLRGASWRGGPVEGVIVVLALVTRSGLQP